MIPVVTIDDPAQAVPLAETLVASGLPVVEVTLRTPKALDAIAAIARAVPEAIVAAGTVVRPAQIGEATRAGAAFIVTPGTPRALAEALAEAPIPVMPGCATVSEAMALAELGFTALKFFPAAASGGAAWLKGIAGPLPHLAFCPTGGIDAANASSLSRPAERALRRRDLGRACRRHRGRRLRPDRRAGPRRRRARPSLSAGATRREREPTRASRPLCPWIQGRP